MFETLVFLGLLASRGTLFLGAPRCYQLPTCAPRCYQIPRDSPRFVHLVCCSLLESTNGEQVMQMMQQRMINMVFICFRILVPSWIPLVGWKHIGNKVLAFQSGSSRSMSFELEMKGLRFFITYELLNYAANVNHRHIMQQYSTLIQCASHIAHHRATSLRTLQLSTRSFNICLS